MGDVKHVFNCFLEIVLGRVFPGEGFNRQSRCRVKLGERGAVWQENTVGRNAPPNEAGVVTLPGNKRFNLRTVGKEGAKNSVVPLFDAELLSRAKAGKLVDVCEPAAAVRESDCVIKLRLRFEFLLLPDAPEGLCDSV